MDEDLPSYQSAVYQDPCGLIAPYLGPHELFSCALVCRKWQKTFSSQLWGNPMSHFGVEHDIYGTGMQHVVNSKRELI